MKDNPEKFKKAYSKRDAKPKEKLRRLESGRKRRENGKYKEWQRNNPDKIKGYNLKRQHKVHDITEEEWILCKEYFETSCAYCGLTENEHRELYHQDLHKDHVDHDGLNDLSNCVPACKSCNDSKHTFEINDWYSEDNPKFTKERLNKINKWLEEDYLTVIKIKLTKAIDNI